ncbi:hypothetical protein [Inquilinus limosus]|uniref:Uncharacterized protein n=1 Tax=Inquilinus limosus TaxID=171674 RepID=A0A211ZIZ4_9PROT|nr:hypothetical protein [Inquilinus limosus]OWJ65166.1 hypothetical protein BWR60_21005 [Inquilinus limosus]
MADTTKLGDRWRNYRPSKATAFWSWVAVSALTMLIGFTWGGWVTGGSAQDMARQARAELVADVCVANFLDAPDAQKQLASFKDTSSWRRNDFIKDGGWAKIGADGKPTTEAISLCVKKLGDAKLPAKEQQATNDKADAATVTR